MNELERARDAIAREAWSDAHGILRSLDPSELTGPDWEGLADAAWWLSELEESIAARQRAYAAYAAASEDRRAAAMAARLCVEHASRGEPAVGGGWLMRAQRHLREQPECIEQGFLAVVESNVARFGGDPEGAVTLARRATEIGQRLGDRELTAVAIHLEGLALIATGRIAEGLRLLDEAMVSVLAGELGAFFTGVVYCNVIEACLQLGDIGRAGEWSGAARVWCETIPSESPYQGLCRVNRAQLAVLRGAWTEAEEEASQASEEMLRLDPVGSGAARYQTGEVHRRSGDLAGAEEAFARARELGFDPQPGSALLRLARGDAEAAAGGLDAALASEPGNPLRRATLLAARVEVALAAGGLDAARNALDELEAIAHRAPTRVLAAMVDSARGELLLAEGEATDALEHLRRSCTGWRELRLPYDLARARVACGQALRAVGDEDAAHGELRAALAEFERLGARPDALRVAGLLRTEGALPGGLTGREAEVLRLVAAGRSNREIASELVISEHTVARHLQNIFAKLDVSSRSGATAFAFEHGLA